ncbi:MAG: hypothetical protein O3B24_06885 [Verrucomicrobia bacterium]|nr:hypothetical protein [Verrucomicrobiota bacterium]
MRHGERPVGQADARRTDHANAGGLSLGPDLLTNLRKTVEMMLKYWRSARDGYYQSSKGG